MSKNEINLMVSRYFKIDLSNMSKSNSFQFGLLINQPNINLLGIKRAPKLITDLWVYYQIFELKNGSFGVDAQLEGLIFMFNRMGVKLEIVKRLPDLQSVASHSSLLA